MTRKSCLTALAFVSLLPLSPARAGSPAFDGRPRNAADMNCFSYDAVLGDMFNGCAGARDFIIPFHVAASGGYSVTVQAQSNSSSANVCCRAHAMSGSTSGMSSSAQRCLDSFNTVGTYRQISLPSVNVSSYGSLFVSCNVGAGARIRSASF